MNLNDHFKTINPEEISDNFIKLIGKDWMLITAGNPESFNTMTAAWGLAGVLWKKPVCNVYVRPQRHTFSFIEKATYYTLCFFDESDRHILDFCGAHSGRDTDKAAETGLTPLPTENGNVIFLQARLAIECKILYKDMLRAENFIDTSIHRMYPTNDFHGIYTGEIIHCWLKH